MRLGSSVILGLAFDDRGATCAELSVNGARRAGRKLGRFTFTGNALADPAGTGAALKTFLESHGFAATRAVIGVPSKWLISAERELPPVAGGDALAVLRMQAEAMSLTTGNDMVVDVAGDPSRAAGGKALLVAILREQLDRLTAIADAAGLRVEAITSTSLATYDLLTGGASDRSMLLIGESGSEVVAASNGAARVLRHVSTANAHSDAGIAQLTSELRRTITLAGLPPLTEDKPLLVWNGTGLGEAQLATLSERSGIAVRSTGGLESANAPLQPAAMNGAAGRLPAEAFLPALALAIGGGAGRRGGLAVDLAHSRLAPPKARRFGRGAVWAAVIGIAAIVGLGLLYQTVIDREHQAAVYAEQVKKIAPDVKAATAAIDRIAYGRSYFESRPLILEAMREVTLAFNYDEPIWATTFTIRDNRKGVLQGKATNQALVLALLDRLKANKKLRDVQLVDLREGTTRNREQTFSISFTYAAAD